MTLPVQPQGWPQASLCGHLRPFLRVVGLFGFRHWPKSNGAIWTWAKPTSQNQPLFLYTAWRLQWKAGVTHSAGDSHGCVLGASSLSATPWHVDTPRSLSPVCILRWTLRWWEVRKVFPQYGQSFMAEPRFLSRSSACCWTPPAALPASSPMSAVDEKHSHITSAHVRSCSHQNC